MLYSKPWWNLQWRLIKILQRILVCYEIKMGFTSAILGHEKLILW